MIQQYRIFHGKSTDVKKYQRWIDKIAWIRYIRSKLDITNLLLMKLCQGG